MGVLLKAGGSILVLLINRALLEESPDQLHFKLRCSDSQPRAPWRRYFNPLGGHQGRRAPPPPVVERIGPLWNVISTYTFSCSWQHQSTYLDTGLLVLSLEVIWTQVAEMCGSDQRNLQSQLQERRKSKRNCIHLIKKKSLIKATRNNSNVPRHHKRRESLHALMTASI